MNTKFKILEANELFQNLMGCDFVGDIIGKNPRTWVSNEHIEKFDNALIGLLNGKAIDNIEVNIINEKNKAIYVSLNANVIENGEKKIFCLVRDLSKKKNEEDKKYIQKEKQKDGIKQKLMEIKSELVKLTI
jgi:PAS domain S-box-containing protein